MKKEPSKFIVYKPTFEAVENTQQQLRRHIEQLIQENRPLKDETEKTLFLKELAHSTLGLGTFKKFSIYIDRSYDLGNVESTARWIASLTKSTVIINKEGYSSSPSIEIHKLWEKCLELLYFVFPLALSEAIRMSRETETSGGKKDSYFVGVDHD
jgi:hypothetical protein